MHLPVVKMYLNRLYEPHVHDDVIQQTLRAKTTDELNQIALEITSVSITCMREFSHSTLQLVQPKLHRSITYAICDELENLPSHMGRGDDLRFYLWQYIRFSLNLAIVLEKEDLSSDFMTKDLFPILAFGKEWLETEK